jgi:hypothetical protein
VAIDVRDVDMNGSPEINAMSPASVLSAKVPTGTGLDVRRRGDNEAG